MSAAKIVHPKNDNSKLKNLLFLAVDMFIIPILSILLNSLMPVRIDFEDLVVNTAPMRPIPIIGAHVLVKKGAKISK